MALSFEEISKEALQLSARQRLALVSVLLSADDAFDPHAESAWEAEIESRIKALDEGKAKTISLEEHKKNLENRFSRE